MTLNELSTKIRSFAYECGGGHHTFEEIQSALLETADAIDETIFNITNVSKVGVQTIQKITGMDDRYYELCRRHQREEEHIRVLDILRNQKENKASTIIEADKESE